MKTNLIALLSVMTIALSSCGVTNNEIAHVAALEDTNMQTIPLNVVEEIVFMGNEHYEIIVSKSNGDPNISGNFKTKIDNNRLIISPSDKISSSRVLINAGNLPNITLNGNGNIKMMGNTERAIIHSNGSGDIDAQNFKVKMLSFYSNGSGDSKVYASSQANIFLDGSGNVVVKGSPKLVNRMGNYAYNIR